MVHSCHEYCAIRKECGVYEIWYQRAIDVVCLVFGGHAVDNIILKSQASLLENPCPGCQASPIGMIESEEGNVRGITFVSYTPTLVVYFEF